MTGRKGVSSVFRIPLACQVGELREVHRRSPPVGAAAQADPGDAATGLAGRHLRAP